MENHYMKKNTELQISQTQKKCNRTEELLLEEIEKLRLKTEEENRIHMEIEMFLRKEQQLQAWWRGTMIRREIGGFRLPKKDKDDGKDSKGKGKDKDKRKGKKK
ncbi:hypothetical protein GH733_002953 [Mirounga leonina]|nr:hypothetical protein GH733_002953 [Mirounga leonina]